MTTVAFLKPVISLQGRVATGRQQFSRDQAIVVSATFYDSTGAVANPSAATLTLSYLTLSDGCRVKTSYALVKVGNVWSYTWDSSISQRREISGHIASSDKIYSADFSFRLTASLSNRELAGDDIGNGYCS